MKAGFIISKKENTLFLENQTYELSEYAVEKQIDSSNILIFQSFEYAKFVYNFYKVKGFDYEKSLLQIQFEKQDEINKLYQESLNTPKDPDLFNAKVVENTKVVENKKPEKETLYVSNKSVQINEHHLLFLLAGKALFTILNTETGNRFTFKVKITDKKFLQAKTRFYFVSVLTGNNNESDYTYMGMLKINIFNDHIGEEKTKLEFYLTKKSKILKDANSVKVFSWLLKNIENLPEKVKFFHEGKCARCGRTLTVPESIKCGFGPECIKFINFKK